MKTHVKDQAHLTNAQFADHNLQTVQEFRGNACGVGLSAWYPADTADCGAGHAEAIYKNTEGYTQILDDFPSTFVSNILAR